MSVHRSLRTILFALCVIVLLRTPLHAVFPVTDSAELVVSVWWYDKDHTGGAYPADWDWPPANRLPGTRTEVFYNGAKTPSFTSSVLGIHLNSGVTAGAPFRFRLVNSVFGSITGESAVGAGFPAFYADGYRFAPTVIIPVSHADVDAFPLLTGGALTTDRTQLTLEQILVADSTTSPSIAMDAACVPALDERTLTITVEYLPGCNMSALGSQTATLTQVAPHYPPDPKVYRALSWGAHSTTRTDTTYFSDDTSLSGPVRVTVQLEGYEPDSVTATVAPYVGYHWRALITPSPGASPEDVPQGVRILSHTLPQDGWMIR